MTGICASINDLASASVLSLTSRPAEAIIFSIPGLKASKSASDIASAHLPIVTPSALILDEAAACARYIPAIEGSIQIGRAHV